MVEMLINNPLLSNIFSVSSIKSWKLALPYLKLPNWDFNVFVLGNEAYMPQEPKLTVICVDIY